VLAASVIFVWSMTIVQTVLAGSGLAGVSVNDVDGDELVVNGCGVPVGHSSENAPLAAVTDFEKLIVIVVPAFTSTAAFAGTVVVTDGGTSVVNENA
jgi:hypothetical protein